LKWRRRRSHIRQKIIPASRKTSPAAHRHNSTLLNKLNYFHDPQKFIRPS
jgi:hypothetical protein